MIGKIWLIILGMAAMSTMMAPLAAADNGKPFLPGVTVADKYSNGCVDCHKVLGEKDYRLIKGLAVIEAHSDMDAVVNNLPQDCMKCHKAGGIAEPLGAVIHKAHFGNSAKNAYIAYYKGSCLHCHRIHPEGGEMTLKSGSKNW